MTKSTEKVKRLAVVAWVLMAGAAWPGTYLAVSGSQSDRERLVYVPAEGMCLVKVESPSAVVFEHYGLEPVGSGIARLYRPVGEIKPRGHDYENHRLSAGEKSLRLKGLVPDGEPLCVSVRTGMSCAITYPAASPSP